MAQPTPAAHIVGVVDDGLDAQRPPVLQILFDARVPVEGVDVDLGAVGDDVGLELPAGFGAAALAAFEDQLDQFRAADVEVVGDQGLEEPAGPPRRVEHQGARGLDLAHRQLPPIAGGTVVVGERQRQARPPAFGEHLDRARAEPVADRLQRSRISAGGEPVGQLGTSFFTRRYRNPLTPNGCAKCTRAPQACSTSTAQCQPYVASSTTSGSGPASSSCRPNATGSLTIRTAESCSPDSDWRTITDRCRSRSIPTNCFPSYSLIGASRDSWK
jgi:hypothetical protein